MQQCKLVRRKYIILWLLSFLGTSVNLYSQNMIKMSYRTLSPLNCSTEQMLTRSSPTFPNMQFAGTDFARQTLFPPESCSGLREAPTTA